MKILMVYYDSNCHIALIFTNFSQQNLDDMAWKLNTLPKKSLSWKCQAVLIFPDDSFDFKTYWADKLNLVALKY